MTIRLEVEAPHKTGRKTRRKLHAADKCVLTLYGGGKPPQTLAVDRALLERVEATAEFYAEPIELVIEGVATRAEARAIQRHPYRARIVHVDLVRV